ncbi:MAG: hypothetical protein SGILL_010283, partial [Bacillariaceae sp.]
MDGGLEFGRSLSAPNVIFGSGNADGSFTKSTANGIELGLRGKLRFNSGCSPEDTFNRVGNAGYNFPDGDCGGAGGAGSPTWSYEFSINSDVGCDSVAAGAECTPLDAYDYHIQLDQDRSYCTDFGWTNAVGLMGTVDPVNSFTDMFKPGLALGTESTKQGGGGAPQCGD